MSSSSHATLWPRIAPSLGLAIAAIMLFLITAGYTLYACRAMSGGMSMPGGWTMSMMWMPMPGQSILGQAGMFIGMWTAMMIAMMLPSAMPMILTYRRVLAFHQTGHELSRTTLMTAGYFAVWGISGVLVFIVGCAFAHAAMASAAFSRAVPILSGICLIAAGAYQMTPWKSSCLKHCRDPLSLLADHLHGGRFGALWLGLHHGTYCALCCWSLMAIQIVLGMMNLIVMTIIALIIALEKMMPAGLWLAKSVGVATIATGLLILFYK